MAHPGLRVAQAEHRPGGFCRVFDHRPVEKLARIRLRQQRLNAASQLATADTLVGSCENARQLGRPATALALCGDQARANKLAEETAKLAPKGTIWNEVKLPAILAATALYGNQPAKSIELLAAAAPYERSYLESPYLRGLAYLRLRQGTEATTEFQKIVAHKGVSWGATWIHPNWGLYYSLSYLGMARGFALTGDRAKAKMAFEDLFTLWNAADTDLAIRKSARSEYAQLM